VILRYDEHGLAVARDYFTPLQRINSEAMAGLPDTDLDAAHRVFTALLHAMRDFRDVNDG
jgi:hypothetical protein